MSAAALPKTSTMPAMPATAASLGLRACLVCGMLCRAPADDARPLQCPRCLAPLHSRKPASLQRTWAYLIAALALYVPANLLPVMHSTSLFRTQSNTIMSGVVELWTTGSWPLALLVFVASIVVPGLKIVSLGLLAVSVRYGRFWDPGQRTRLYRLVEFVGRWSMLDIFAVALTVAMVQSPGFATVQAQPGALAFGAVVVLTMLASMSFDPRLIWDRAGDTSAGGRQ